MFAIQVASIISLVDKPLEYVLSIFKRIKQYVVFFLIKSNAFNLLIAGIFIAQKKERPKVTKTIGIVWLLLAIPLAIVFVNYLTESRDLWIMICFGFIFLYMFLELLLDFVLKIEFREKPITHVPYIIMEYIALFSLIAISTDIDQTWGYIVGISFWILMASLVYLYWDKIKRRKKEDN